MTQGQGRPLAGYAGTPRNHAPNIRLRTKSAIFARWRNPSYPASPFASTVCGAPFGTGNLRPMRRLSLLKRRHKARSGDDHQHGNGCGGHDAGGRSDGLSQPRPPHRLDLDDRQATGSRDIATMPRTSPINGPGAKDRSAACSVRQQQTIVVDSGQLQAIVLDSGQADEISRVVIAERTGRKTKPRQ